MKEFTEFSELIVFDMLTLYGKAAASCLWLDARYFLNMDFLDTIWNFERKNEQLQEVS